MCGAPFFTPYLKISKCPIYPETESRRLWLNPELSVTDTTPNFHVRRSFFHSIPQDFQVPHLSWDREPSAMVKSWVKAVVSLITKFWTPTPKRVTAPMTVTWNLYFRNLHEKLCKIWDPWCVWTWNLAVPCVRPENSPVWTDLPHGVKTSFSWLLPSTRQWNHHLKLSYKSPSFNWPRMHFPRPIFLQLTMRKPTALSVTDTTPNFHVRRSFFHSIPQDFQVPHLSWDREPSAMVKSWVKCNWHHSKFPCAALLFSLHTSRFPSAPSILRQRAVGYG